MRLAGKVALVAGAGGGMGTATPLLFAQEGAKVMVAARRSEPLQALVERILAAGGEADFVLADFTDEASVRDAVAATEARFGRLDIVVNNLGESEARGRTAENTSLEDWTHLVDLNLKPAYLLTRFAAPALRRAGGGVILHLGASYDILMDGNAGYAAAKTALVAFTEKTALELRADRIRVVCLAPNAMMAIYEPTTPVPLPDPNLERDGSPLDLAWTALFFASGEAGWLTGVTVPVDGARSRETRAIVLPPHLAHLASGG